MKKLTVPNIKNFFKELNYRHYICVVITAVFVVVSALVFPYAYGRIAEAFRDFGRSIGYWFVKSFGLPAYIAPSVTTLSKMPFTISDKFPSSWEDFKVAWDKYWEVFANGENFLSYLNTFQSSARGLSIALSVFVPVCIAFFVLLYVALNKNVGQYVGDSKPLRVFKRISDKTYVPAKARAIEFKEFVKSHKCYLYIWGVIWAFNFNLFSIAVECAAYYYYFVSSIDVASLYTQFYKLLLDLSVMFKFIPAWGWMVIGCVLFNAFRKYIGYKKLNHHEAKNCGFINERGVFSLIVAPMRSGKTKLSTSMALSMAVSLRRMAYDVILESDLKFPNFPWLAFECSLMKAMDKGSVYNLATVKRFVLSKMMKFYKHPQRRYVFGYEFYRYGLEYDNAKYIEKLEDVLVEYAQAYFVFVCQTSLIVSNYSIREDDELVTRGNFPKWNSEFFKIDSKYAEAHSRHSHILDYDIVRLGKKVCDNSKFAFEFGVLDITEIAKECLNQVEMQGIDKDSDESNPKNDGFVDWVKMCGHNANIAHRCFLKIFSDDQREQNLRAGLREVGEILRVEDVEKDKLAMPGFFLGEILYAIHRAIITKLHITVRYNKENCNFLLYYLLHTLASKIESYYKRIYGIFGYELMSVSIQDGAQENEKRMYKYYISNKKDLSKRYATDCLGDMLSVRALRASVGMDKTPTYKSVRATKDELDLQKSHFIMSINEKLSESLNVIDSKRNKAKIHPLLQKKLRQSK